jgi:DNA segregation ATPase FtsK/SpoIIIE-like protein
MAPVLAETSVAPGEPRIIDTKPALQVEPVVVVKKTPKRGSFQLPSYDLLQSAVVVTNELDKDKILEHATRLEKTLADYGVAAKVEEIHPGPTVTTYEVACEAGTKVSKVASRTISRSACRARCASSRRFPVRAASASSCRTTSAWP